MADEIEGIRRIRYAAKELEVSAAEACSEPELRYDEEFWMLLDEIEAVARDRDTSKSRWLADFTQIDEFDSNARNWLLATAALEALKQVPRAAFDAGRAIFDELPASASKYRKTGLCKVLEASGMADAAPYLEHFLNDADSYVRMQAEGALKNIWSSSES